jgi:hypothetical protein
MSILKFSSVLIILLVFASQFFVSVTKATVSESEAASALANAEEMVSSAYQAVSKAEESGANVSSLLVRLNEAGWFLARAQVAYNSGDFDSAQKFAAQSQDKLNGFVADANALKETAIKDCYLDFLVNVVGSVIGAISVVCVSFFLWFLLKRRYEKAGSVV